MKKICMFCWVVLCFLQLRAQDKGVLFQELSFKEALNKAKVENKLVFMDCYTSWCGPCKYMLNTVFVLPEMGAFFNDQFVNVKYDMEKGEGPWLRGRFHINSYPTFLILRPDGTLQHRIVGSRKAADFMECVKRGAKEECSQFYLDQLYQQGKLNKQQLALYRAGLMDAKENAKLKQVTGEEFKQLSDKEKCLPAFWYVYDQDEIEPEDERFAYLVEHKTDFDKKIGKGVVDQRIYDNYFKKLGNIRIDASVNDMISMMRKQVNSIDFEKKEEILLSLRFVEARNNKNIDAMLELLDKDLQVLSRVFLWQAPFLNFIIEKGNKEQVDRYITMENNFIELLENENMKKIVKETFVKYRAAQN